MSDETPDSLIPYDAIVQEALRAVVPWAAGGTGALLLLGGGLLVARSRPARTDSPEDEPARVPVPTA